jgi:hypothetical protein
MGSISSIEEVPLFTSFHDISLAEHTRKLVTRFNNFCIVTSVALSLLTLVSYIIFGCILSQRFYVAYWAILTGFWSLSLFILSWRTRKLEKQALYIHLQLRKILKNKEVRERIGIIYWLSFPTFGILFAITGFIGFVVTLSPFSRDNFSSFWENGLRLCFRFFRYSFVPLSGLSTLYMIKFKG